MTAFDKLCRDTGLWVLWPRLHLNIPLYLDLLLTRPMMYSLAVLDPDSSDEMRLFAHVWEPTGVQLDSHFVIILTYPSNHTHQYSSLSPANNNTASDRLSPVLTLGHTHGLCIWF